MANKSASGPGNAPKVHSMPPVYFVIPSEIEETRGKTSRWLHRAPSTSLGMTKPVRSQQIFQVHLPLERREIVELFAGADEARGNSKFILDCYHNAAFATAIEFGHD